MQSFFSLYGLFREKTWDDITVSEKTIFETLLRILFIFLSYIVKHSEIVETLLIH